MPVSAMTPGVNSAGIIHLTYFGLARPHRERHVWMWRTYEAKRYRCRHALMLVHSFNKVGYGYMLVMPKAEYITWKGQRLEGSGVKPDVEVPWIPVGTPDYDNQAEGRCKFYKTHEERDRCTVAAYCKNVHFSNHAAAPQ